MNRNVQRKLANAMTVGELINQLEMMPDDAIVGFTVNYGDRGRTLQFLPVGDVREPESNESVEETAYSESGLGIRKRDEDDDDPDDPEEKPDGDAPKIVILS